MNAEQNNDKVPSVFFVSSIAGRLNTQIEDSSARAYLALATGSLAFVLATINVTVSNVAFPEIVKAFPGISNGTSGWIISGYALAFSSTLLSGGRLADRYGRLPIFKFGLIGLLISSIAAGFANNIWVLVAARAAQGVCGALTVPSSLALVLPKFLPSKQASVIGLWAAAGMAASGLAPGLAAFILEFGSWRLIYLILAPISCLGLIGAKFFLDETAERDSNKSLDLLGISMGSGSIFFLVLATLQGRSWGWNAPITITCFLISAILLTSLVSRSKNHPEPAIDLDLFRIRSFTVANIAVALSMVGAFTSWFLWPVYLTEVWNYSKLSIGLAFTPAPVISALVAILSGRWADKHGFRGLMGLASFLAASGHIWLFFFLNETINFWFSFFPATVLFGLGMGVLASQLNSAALLAIPAKSIATANGIHQSLRYAVGAMGAATAIAILNGTHEVWRYDLMWLLLAGMQMAVIPLMLFAYPKSKIKK